MTDTPKLKLYRVTIEAEFYCLAHDEREAEDLADDFERDNSITDDARAREVTPGQVPQEWRKGLLYHPGEDDISLDDFVSGRVQS